MQLGCYNGTSLFWYYYPSEEMARMNYESIPGQIERQMKKFKKKVINCFLLDEKITAQKLSYKTHDGHKGFSILAYGIVNNQPVFLQLVSMKQLRSNNEIQPVFRQIIRFAE